MREPIPFPLQPRIDRDAERWRAFLDANDDASNFRAWLELQCAQIDHAIRAVIVLGDPQTGEYAPVGTWPADDAANQDLASACEQILAEPRTLVLRKGDDGEAADTAIGLPVATDEGVRVIVAIALHDANHAEVQAALRTLQWGVAWLELRLRRDQARADAGARERLKLALDLCATALNERELEASARAVATELASRLASDRVSIAFRHGKRAEVSAISHGLKLDRRANAVRLIAAAADESIDQIATVLHPASSAVPAAVDRAAIQLARSGNGSAVLVIPFSDADAGSGAFIVERAQSHPFLAEEVGRLEAVAAIVGRVLLTVRHAHAPVLDHLARGAVGWSQRKGLKTLVWLLLIGGAIFALSTIDGEYRIAGNATLEGAVRRVLVAPNDGFVIAAPKRAGDLVRAGEVLVSLDDRELRLERAKWASQLGQYEKQLQEAVAQGNRAQLRIISAQMDQARAQLERIESELKRLRLAVPIEGVIVNGDLSQSLGGPVQQGQVLFEIAPLNAYRVAVEIDEADIASIAPEQSGTLVLSALADQKLALKVTRVTPIASVADGRNVFRVEAQLEQATAVLRPGMKGVAKFDGGERKLIWIWTRRLIDWARVSLWRWWP